MEELGFQLGQDELNEVFESFKDLADRKREVTDQDLETLLSDSRRTADVPTTYDLQHVQVSTGDHGVPTATVKIKNAEGEEITDAATCSSVRDLLTLGIFNLYCGSRHPMITS